MKNELAKRISDYLDTAVSLGTASNVFQRNDLLASGNSIILERIDANGDNVYGTRSTGRIVHYPAETIRVLRESIERTSKIIAANELADNDVFVTTLSAQVEAVIRVTADLQP